MDFLVDAHLLSHADGFVGKFSSTLSRAAYSLMVARADCLHPFVSLDMPWCFGLGCRKEGNEAIKREWRRRQPRLQRGQRRQRKQAQREHSAPSSGSTNKRTRAGLLDESEDESEDETAAASTMEHRNASAARASTAAPGLAAGELARLVRQRAVSSRSAAS